MKHLPMLEEIYYEAFFPIRVDHEQLLDSRTNNVKVNFTAFGVTVSRTLEELCRAARIPFYEVSIDINESTFKENFESIFEYLYRLSDRRNIKEPWCIDICASILKILAEKN